MHVSDGCGNVDIGKLTCSGGGASQMDGSGDPRPLGKGEVCERLADRLLR